MNHGLLAPQFGVGRADDNDPDQDAHPAAKGLWSPTAPGSGPTVTIKRRRLVESPAVESERTSTAPAKTSKVFTLQNAPMQPRPLERAEAIPALELASAPSARRRRDPLRKPTLVQHIVFEHPKVEPPTADQPAVRPEDAASPKVSAKALRGALEKLDEELRRSTRCREAAMALDAHFKRLGF